MRGAGLSWNATGGAAASRTGLDRITVLGICLVGWPALALGLVFAAGHALSAACVLRPLRRAAVAIDDVAVPADSGQSSIVTRVPIGV